jgi:hypothetical protein
MARKLRKMFSSIGVKIRRRGRASDFEVVASDRDK